MSNDFDFDLTPRIQEITIGENRYVLKEADESSATQYRDAMLRCTKLGADGKPTQVDGLAATEPLLVSLCLMKTGNDGHLIPAGLQFVNGLPSRIVKKMYMWIRDSSDLAEETNERSLLSEALSMKDAPITLPVLRDWANTNLDQKEFKPLLDWLKPTAEETAKNESSPVTTGNT
jgi:hypothetical protein